MEAFIDPPIITIVILIIQTNGVSFELVAGACCAVAFSNELEHDWSSNSTKASTLNINSTGAKSFSRYTTSSGSSNEQLYPAKGAYLFIYNGSKYQFVTVQLRNYYDD